MGNIQVGEEAYYCEDDGLGGFVIDRTNGDWDYTFRNFLGMDQNFNVLQETKFPWATATELLKDVIAVDVPDDIKQL